MKNKIWVRRAASTDAVHVVAIIQEGFDAWVNERTIYGSSGINRYVEDAIGAVHFSVPQFLAAGIDTQVLAVAQASVRQRDVMLSYICTREGSRSMGLGRELMKEVAQLGSEMGGSVILDVFRANIRAIEWYQSFNFVETSKFGWWEPIGERRSSGPGGPVVVSGLPQADLCQTQFGFSEFTLEVDSGSYQVGRLGSKWFRLTDVAAACDPDLVAALNKFEPSRSVLVQCLIDDRTRRYLGDPVLESIHMSVEIGLLRSKLESNSGLP